MWEPTRVPGGNPPARLGDHMTISHAMPGMEPGSQQWEASALSLPQLDSQLCCSNQNVWIKQAKTWMYL